MTTGPSRTTLGTECIQFSPLISGQDAAKPYLRLRANRLHLAFEHARCRGEFVNGLFTGEVRDGIPQIGAGLLSRRLKRTRGLVFVRQNGRNLSCLRRLQS